jgi:hypothetical protein
VCRPAGDDRSKAARLAPAPLAFRVEWLAPGLSLLAGWRVFWHHQLPLPVNGMLRLGDLALR